MTHSTSTSKAITLNTLYQLLARFVSATVSLVITFVISRQLGLIAFGDLVKIISFTSVFYMPLDFGMNAIALRLYRHYHSLSSVTTNLISLRFSLSLILIFILLLITFFLPGTQSQGFTPTVKTGIYLLSITIVFHSLIKSTHAVFQHLLAYQNIIIAELIQALTLIIATLYTILITHHILTAVVGYIIGAALASLSQWFLSSRHIHLTRPLVSISLWKQLILPSLPLGITLIISTLNARIDILIPTVFHSTVTVAHYGLAKRIIDVFLVIPTFYSNSLYPIFLKNSRLSQPLRQAVIPMFLTSITSTLAIFIFSPLLSLIKPEFAAAVPLIRLLSLTLPLFFISAPLLWKAISLGLENQLVVIYAISLAFNTIINLTFTPSIGFPATIMAIAVSEVSTLVLLVYLLSKPTHYLFFKSRRYTL